MAKDILHVVPHENGWAVKREGNERTSSTHATQKDAIDAARELAKERDDLVIHRPDGTIRERVTYTGGNGHSTNPDHSSEVHPRDVASVGTRVSWSAVVAGVVVALGVYVILSVLAFAIGLSTIDQVQGRTFAVTAAIVAGITLLVAMFLGGFMASRVTVGEQPGEAMTYGVLVWGTALLLILASGVGVGANYLGAVRQSGPASEPVMTTETMKRELGLTDQQAEKYAAVTREPRALAQQSTPQELAWWGFATLGLSLLAAIGGGLTGAGPRLRLFAHREPRPAVVAPQPA